MKSMIERKEKKHQEHSVSQDNLSCSQYTTIAVRERHVLTGVSVLVHTHLTSLCLFPFLANPNKLHFHAQKAITWPIHHEPTGRELSYSVTYSVKGYIKVQVKVILPLSEVTACFLWFLLICQQLKCIPSRSFRSIFGVACSVYVCNGLSVTSYLCTTSPCLYSFMFFSLAPLYAFFSYPCWLMVLESFFLLHLLVFVWLILGSCSIWKSFEILSYFTPYNMLPPCPCLKLITYLFNHVLFSAAVLNFPKRKIKNKLSVGLYVGSLY